MRSPCQSNGMHCARNVFEGIFDRMILHFNIIANMGFWFLVMTGHADADEFKRTKRVQGWSCQIMGGSFCYLHYYYFVK